MEHGQHYIHTITAKATRKVDGVPPWLRLIHKGIQSQLESPMTVVRDYNMNGKEGKRYQEA